MTSYKTHLQYFECDSTVSDQIPEMISETVKFLTLMIILDILHLLLLHTMIIIDQSTLPVFAAVFRTGRRSGTGT